MATDAHDSSGTELFRCPTCGASLEVVDAPSVKCKYCGNPVPVPPELRPQKPQVVIQQVDYSAPQYAEATKASRSMGASLRRGLLMITFGASRRWRCSPANRRSPVCRLLCRKFKFLRCRM